MELRSEGTEPEKKGRNEKLEYFGDGMMKKNDFLFHHNDMSDRG